MMNITKNQWVLIAAIVIIMVIDAIISIYGALGCDIPFYEVNPLLAAFRTAMAFSVGMVILKIVAMFLVLYLISKCNSIGEFWGDMACYGGIFTTSYLIGTMAFINLHIVQTV